MPFGEGLTSQIILAAAQPLLLNRRRALRGLDAAMVGTPVQSYLGVPIIARRRGDRRDQRPEHRRTRGASAPPTSGCWRRSPRTSGSAIQNAQLYRDAAAPGSTRWRRSPRSAREISATLDLEVVLERMAERAASLLEVDTSAVFLAEPTARRSAPSSPSARRRRRDQGRPRSLLGEGIIGDVGRGGEAEIVNDVHGDTPRRPDPRHDDAGRRGATDGRAADWPATGSSA